MALACKYCILIKGLKGSEISQLPQTEEELMQHIEREHHIPVRRDNETVEEAMARFKRENPDAGGPNCKCPDCQHQEQVSRLIEMLAGATRLTYGV